MMFCFVGCSCFFFVAVVFGGAGVFAVFFFRFFCCCYLDIKPLLLPQTALREVIIGLRLFFRFRFCFSKSVFGQNT